MQRRSSSGRRKDTGKDQGGRWQECLRNGKEAEWLELRAWAAGGLSWRAAVSGQKSMECGEQGSRVSSFIPKSSTLIAMLRTDYRKF